MNVITRFIMSQFGRRRLNLNQTVVDDMRRLYNFRQYCDKTKQIKKKHK